MKRKSSSKKRNSAPIQSDTEESFLDDALDLEEPKKKKLKNGDKNNSSKNGSDSQKNSPKKKLSKKYKAEAEENNKFLEHDVSEGNESNMDNSEKEDAEYEVEKIVNEKMVGGFRHFLIRWKGFNADSDTWEPESVLNCPDIIDEYKKQKKMSKKKNMNKKKQISNEVWDENANFEVLRILDVHFRRDGKREFLVTWKGYPASYNSWEPENNMDCKDLIEKFLNRCDKAREATQKDLRINRKCTDRFTLSTKETGRRLSKRNQGRQRIHYHEAE